MALHRTPWLFLVVISATVLFACASSAEPDRSTSAGSAPTSEAPSTTTTIANRAPEFREFATARAEIGQRFSDAIITSDPDGDDVTVRLGAYPPGFSPIMNSRGSITGFDWRPAEAGEWDVEVTATDSSGARTTATLQLAGRSPRSTSLVLSMGDSIAAGFGRDRSDYLGTDDCFRSERDAYATQTSRALVDAGALGEDAEVLLLGCADMTVGSLVERSIYATDDNGKRAEGEATSVDWAAMLNPTIITLTVGGEDAGFFGQELPLVERSGASSGDAALSIDRPRLAEMTRRIESELGLVLDRLLRTTDAHIAITTYYDPTAADPIGVDQCRGSCFASVMAEAVDELNAAIVRAAESASMDRISIVRLDGDNDAWEAGNGLGPDVLRDGLGPLGGVFDRFTQGSSATCADSGGPPLDLVSSLDCVHPNSEGHERISRLVTSVLLSI